VPRISLSPLRVAVFAAGGTPVYFNHGPEDAPRKAPASAIVSRALVALRAPDPK